MNRINTYIIACCILLLTTSARADTQGQATQPTAAKIAGLRLEDATPVRLRIQRTLSSADAQSDERVDFDVLEEVRVGDLVVIPKGSLALGTVTEAQANLTSTLGGTKCFVYAKLRFHSVTMGRVRARF
jgi:hypothetical protein